MNMVKRLPTVLQIRHAEDLFCDLNPPCDALDLIDLKATMDGTLSFKENIENLSFEYPQFKWVKPEEVKARTYEKEIVDSARKDVGEFSYDILKGYKVKDLEAKARKLGRTETALEECKIERGKPQKSIPGVCRIRTVDVKAHKRCAPRR